MQSIVKYINEGFFKNTGLDQISATKKWFIEMTKYANIIKNVIPDAAERIEMEGSRIFANYNKKVQEAWFRMTELAKELPVDCGIVIDSGKEDRASRVAYIRSNEYKSFDYCSYKIKEKVIVRWNISQPAVFIANSFIRDKIEPIIVLPGDAAEII